MKFECELRPVANNSGNVSGLKLSSVCEDKNTISKDGISKDSIVLTIEGRCVIVSPSELIDAIRRVAGLSQ